MVLSHKPSSARHGTDGIRADDDDDVSSCRVFCSIPGPLQSVQRAEMWRVLLALQSSGAIHLGVDNLGVVRHVGRLLDGRHGPSPRGSLGRWFWSW